MRGECEIASCAMRSVMKPASAIATSTTWARRQARRRLDEAREQRRLRNRHLPGRLAEVTLRRGLDAIRAGAEIDPVEVELEDLLLGKLALEPERQHDFLELARDG